MASCLVACGLHAVLETSEDDFKLRTGSPTEVAILRACAEATGCPRPRCGGFGGPLRCRSVQVAGGPGPTATLKSKSGPRPTFFGAEGTGSLLLESLWLQARELQSFRDSLQLRKQVRTSDLERVELRTWLHLAAAQVDAHHSRHRRPGKLLRGAFSSTELALCLSQHAPICPFLKIHNFTVLIP